MSARMLQALHQFIQDNGTFDDRCLADSQLPQQWVFKSITAFVDGKMIGLETPTMRVTQLMNHPLLYWRGSEVELVFLATELLPNMFPSQFRLR
jgi:hypothetical protein